MNIEHETRSVRVAGACFFFFPGLKQFRLVSTSGFSFRPHQQIFGPHHSTNPGLELKDSSDRRFLNLDPEMKSKTSIGTISKKTAENEIKLFVYCAVLFIYTVTQRPVLYRDTVFSNKLSALFGLPVGLQPMNRAAYNDTGPIRRPYSFT